MSDKQVRPMDNLLAQWVIKYKNAESAYEDTGQAWGKSFLNAKIWSYYHCVCELCALLGKPKPPQPEFYEEVWE